MNKQTTVDRNHLVKALRAMAKELGRLKARRISPNTVFRLLTKVSRS